MSDRIQSEGRERREFVRKSLYVAPAILTLQAYSAVAKAGSVKPDEVRDRFSTKSDKFEQRSAKLEQKLELKRQRIEEKRAAKREKFELKFSESKNGKGPKEVR